MHRIRHFAAVLVVLLCAAPALAQPPAGDCLIGPGLGATLLFPYFELDLANPLNVTTLVAITNGYGSPTLTRVVLWTDWGVPTIAFDVYLDPFAVQTINLRDVFNGNIPSTGVGGDFSSFAWCGTYPPSHANPALTVNQRDQLAADHTGVDGPIATNCAGSYHPDQIARGYITVDVVDECSGVEGYNPVYTPANTTYPYFANGTGAGIAIDANRIWGDVVYIDATNAAAQGSEAVTLWADPTKFAATGIYTFYGRFSGWDGRDDRVPLPYMWDQRFLNGGPLVGGADLIVWRDTEVLPAFASCGATPTWYPLATSTNNALDEAGDNLVNFGNGHFPNATQRVSVSSLSIPFAFGWAQIASGTGQSWVQPTLRASGLYSAGWNGAPVQFHCGAHP